DRIVSHKRQTAGGPNQRLPSRYSRERFRNLPQRAKCNLYTAHLLLLFKLVEYATLKPLQLLGNHFFIRRGTSKLALDLQFRLQIGHVCRALLQARLLTAHFLDRCGEHFGISCEIVDYIEAVRADRHQGYRFTWLETLVYKF